MSYAEFIQEVECFKPYHESIDLCWSFFLREKRKWLRVSVQKYLDEYYVNTSDRVGFSYPSDLKESELGRQVAVWAASLRELRLQISADPISAQAHLISSIPLEHRTGVILRTTLFRLMPDWMRFDQELSDSEKKKLVEIFIGSRGETIENLTTDRYFEYCRVAYLANYDQDLSGREYYKRFADGRDGGLLELDGQDSNALKKWLKSGRHSGSHPWEIYRGGNSTHIGLSIVDKEYENRFEIRLGAFSSTRLVETCRIALAFHKAGLPFTLSGQDSYLKRILSEDWVGILPSYTNTKYGWQEFPEDYSVSDCIHLDWIFESLPKKKHSVLRRKLRKLVGWFPDRLTLELAEIACKKRKKPGNGKH